MASVQSPLLGLEMSSETSVYVGLLERQVAAYAIQEAKFRALLELITGDSWETAKLDMDGKVLMAIAVDALIKKTNMSVVQAKRIVSDRWNTVNKVSTTPTPSSVPIEQIVSEVNSAENNTVASTPAPGLSMRQRLADWRNRQEQAAASVSDSVGVPATENNVSQSATADTTNATGATTETPDEQSTGAPSEG